ncbi:MAG: hypothetical protein H7320_03660 [Ferruginibacter sp.]|nr:hypothetical protein [Ferruginibacter sp.]
MAQTIFLIVGVLLSFLLYIAVLLLIKLVYKIYYKDAKPFMGTIWWQKLIAILIAAALLAVQIYSGLFSSPSRNTNKAIIEKENGLYVITLFGKRESVTNSPISALQKTVYEDSIKIEVPKADGVINGADILNRNSNFKYKKGSITINKNTLNMELFYTDAYYKITTPSSWNGLYQLEWKK